MSVFVNTLFHRTRCINIGENISAKDFKLFLADFEGIPVSDFVIVCDGVILQDNSSIRGNTICQVFPRIHGGKGGFGSMLRAIGAQIEKTTNREACRDLSGRRLRDINDEKRLKKWIAKQSDRERESECHRRERLERRLAMPRFEFRDPAYEAERRAIPERVDEAVYQGLNRAGSSKRKADSSDNSTNKKSCLWIAADLDSDISDPEEEDMDHCLQQDLNENSSTKENVSSENMPYDSEVSSSPTENRVIKNTSDSEESDSIGLKSSLVVDSATCRENDVNVNKGEHFQLPSSVNDPCVSSPSKPDDSSVVPIEPQMSAPVSESEDQASQDSLNLTDYHCVEDLEVLGLERLKLALMSLGLKCGGTLQERAKRLFSVKGLQFCDINPSLLAKPNKK